MKPTGLLPWVPNLITLARFLAVPGLVYFVLLSHMAGAFWIFVAAGISDALDGLIAKRWNCVTRLGTFLDPLADKVLLVAAYVTLGMQDYIPLWLVILVVSRDLMIIGGAVLYHQLTDELKPRPLLISKVNTAMQILLVAVILAQPGLGIALPTMIDSLLIWTTGLTTLLSGAAYVITWGGAAMRSENRE